MFTAVPRVAVDSLGTEIPGGLHIARYGGGGTYVAVDPLLSVWLGEPRATDSLPWHVGSALFRETKVAELQLDGHRAEFEKALRFSRPVCSHGPVTRVITLRSRRRSLLGWLRGPVTGVERLGLDLTCDLVVLLWWLCCGPNIVWSCGQMTGDGDLAVLPLPSQLKLDEKIHVVVSRMPATKPELQDVCEFNDSPNPRPRPAAPAPSTNKPQIPAFLFPFKL